MEDINQHFEQLRRLLVKLGYPHSIEKDRICAGVTTELLPLLHFGLLSHSKVLATFILDAGYDLYQKNDLKFSEGIFKLVRKEFEYNPVLQCQQFLTDKGFAKRKIQFVVKCLKLGVAKHNELIKKKKMENQSKVSWNETNLAKKMEKEIKKKAAKKQEKMPKKIRITKPKKPIKAKKMNPVPMEIHAEPQQNVQHIEHHHIEQQQQEDEMLNDSLTADEIRRVLPTPTKIHKEEEESEQQQQHHFEDEKEEDLMNEVEEEKEMEMEPEMVTKGGDFQPIESDNQSMQIPQHSYDMNLIPEYDPSKYMQSSPMTKNNDDNDDEEEDKENMNDEIRRTSEHYSGSYLDTYSTLMDIPQIMGNDEDNLSSDEKQNENSFHDNSSKSFDKSEENGDEDQENKDYDDNNDQNEEEGDDDDDDDSDERQSKTPNSVQQSIQMIMQRLDNMENRMDQQFQTINARLTILEGKVKFVEGHQTSQSSKSTSGNVQTTSTEQASTNSKAASAPPKPRSVTPSSTENGDGFSKSTIGSSTMPVSLTPGPMTTNVNRKQEFQSAIPRSSLHLSHMPIQSNLENRFISANNQKPKHIHPPIARSPFIGSSVSSSMNPISSMQPFVGRGNMFSSGGQSLTSSSSGMYGINPHVDIMRYPLSSSSGGNNMNKTTPIPHIQNVALSSASDQKSSASSGDPDSTLNFINELKEMLKSTDRLLKNKPMSLYDTQV